MLIHRAILLLLSWPCVRSIETEKPPPEDIFDQIATASENLGLSFVNTDSFLKPTPNPITTIINKATTIHYENSNGFIPITSIPAIPSISPEILEKNSTDEDRLSIGPAASTELLEDDPAYSTEARMFLNLAGPSADRRSFDTQDGQSDFEILKVTNETPAIANYHDFYENMQNKLHRGRGGTEGRYEEPEESTSGRSVAQNQRTKDRIKKIDKYLTKFNGDRDLRNNDAYDNYYSFGNANTKPSNKPIFEPEKVQSNYNQQSGSTIYDVYDDNPTTRQRSSSFSRSNYEGVGTRNSLKSHVSTIAKNRHVNSKPVVVVEPSDYKLDMKYGPDQTKVSNIDHYRNQKLRNEPEEHDVQARSQYDMEPRVNREDRYGLSYDRNEDIGDYSEEENDYMEVTEKPRRLHKSRRRPHSSDTSRRLPKEHRGHQSTNDESDDSRKQNSPTRTKLHRPKAKPSYWNEEDTSNPISEESSEEQQQPTIKSNPAIKSEGSSSNKPASKGKVINNWSQIGPNLEVSSSNGFEIDQLNKPKLLLPVNLNLLPISSFDHSTALGNSQGFDFTNVPNFVTGTPIVSSSIPLLSTSQSVINANVAHPSSSVKNNPNIVNNNYGLSTAVPDIIVGQTAYRNPVQAILLPQMSINNKFASNLRPHYLPSTASPMFAVTQSVNQNGQHLNPTVQSLPVHSQHFPSTVSPRVANQHQSLHHFTINPTSPSPQPQFVVPQPAPQSFPQSPLSGISNHNILVNPNGLHGQNLLQHGNQNQGTMQITQQPPTTLQPIPIVNNNLHGSESQMKKNTGQNTDGHFLTGASFAVGNGEQQRNVGNDHKYLPTNNQHINNNNNNNYYNENQNNQQLARPNQQQNFYQVYRDDENSNQNFNQNFNQHSNQNFNQHSNQNMNQHSNQNLNQHSNQNLNQHSNQNLNQHSNQNLNQQSNQNLNQHFSQNLNQHSNQNLNHHSNQNLNQHSNQNLNQHSNQNLNQHSSQHSNQNLNQHSSQHSNQNLNQHSNQNMNHNFNQNSNAKQYLQSAHENPTIVHQSQSIPVNFNNQNYANIPSQLQEQQSVMSPTIVANRARDQNQQILKAANDIFENTWKQLQQLQKDEVATKNVPYQHVYRVNDNLPSTSNFNSNIANMLPGVNGNQVNQVKAHLPILGTQNVEILNPNMKPSPIDLTLINPYASMDHYPTAVLTTQIPIFSTAASFLTPRPAVTNTSPESLNLQNYVNSLTQIGAHSNQANKVEIRPGVNQENQRSPLFNPINFVPNIDLMKSQSMLNSKLVEPLPHQLNLVPVIPGGNFFKNTFGAQSELVQKPRLSSDLEKYAEEMFKESLKTIYSTHKWNNDRRSRGNYTVSEVNDLAKLKSELQRFKASMPDPSFSGKDVLEGHQSETKVRTTEPAKTTKKPDLSIAAIEQLFKAAVKNNSPSSTDSSHNSRHKNRQNSGHTSSRPGSSNDHSNDFRKHHLSDYLTPPKMNSFVSKSPFNDAPKPIKKRPGSSSSRYNSNNNSRPNSRPSASRPASGAETSASNHHESGVHAPRYDKYQHRPSQFSRDKDPHRHIDLSDYRTDQGFENYPTFTTTSSPEDDVFKPSSGEQSLKSEYFDINHPRTHNLLGLLMKNKQLPTGTAQSFFRDDDELKQYFDNEKRRMRQLFYDDNGSNFQKKVDGNPIIMAPPAPPNIPQIRYFDGRNLA